MPLVVTDGEMRAAQIVTAVTMALFLLSGRIPAAQRNAGTIRAALLGFYVLFCLFLVLRVLAR